MSWALDILIMLGAASAAVTLLVAAYALWCCLIAPVIGRVAGAIDRRLSPVTPEEHRRVLADERAARSVLRPYGSVEEVSTIQAPNGYHKTYRGDPRA